MNSPDIHVGVIKSTSTPNCGVALATYLEVFTQSREQEMGDENVFLSITWNASYLNLRMVDYEERIPN